MRADQAHAGRQGSHTQAGPAHSPPNAAQRGGQPGQFFGAPFGTPQGLSLSLSPPHGLGAADVAAAAAYEREGADWDDGTALERRYVLQACAFSASSSIVPVA